MEPADTSSFDPFSIDQTFYACVHEAGHTVAAREMGLPVAWVSIDPTFLTTDPLAVENDCASGLPVTMVLASDLLNPILKRGFAMSAEERELVRGYCLEVLAGPLAEERFNPLFAPQVAGKDVAQVGLVLERLEKDKFKRRRRQASLFKEAAAFVEQHSTSILSFASVLYDRKTIQGGEIDQLIREPASTMSLPIMPRRSEGLANAG